MFEANHRSQPPVLDGGCGFHQERQTLPDSRTERGNAVALILITLQDLRCVLMVPTAAVQMSVGGDRHQVLLCVTSGKPGQKEKSSRHHLGALSEELVEPRESILFSEPGRAAVSGISHAPVSEATSAVSHVQVSRHQGTGWISSSLHLA